MENLILTLTEQTQDLKVSYIKHTKEFSELLFVKIANTTQQQIVNERGYTTNSGGKAHTKASFAYWGKIASIQYMGLDKYVAKQIKNAEAHYTNSIAKLAFRILGKGLNMDNLTVTTESKIDKGNIDTYITDGVKSIHAFTILAWGEIQAPHYRYLIK